MWRPSSETYAPRESTVEGPQWPVSVPVSVRNWPNQVTTNLRSIVREFREENITFMAGSIAYSAFVSLLPMLLLALLAASVVGGNRLESFVVGMTEQYLTSAGQDMVLNALQQAEGRASFSVFGILVLLWSVLKVFRSLDVAFSSLYHTPGRNSITDQVKDGLVVLAGIGVAVAAMFLATIAARLLPGFPFIETISVLFLMVALTIAFLPVYYVFPDVDLEVSDVLPGAVVAAVGWTVLQALFQVYTTYSSTSDLYGAIGGIILLVTYLYFASIIVLLGAATNVVVSGRGSQFTAPSESERRSPAE